MAITTTTMITSFSSEVVVDLIVRVQKAGHLSGPWSDDLHHDDDASLISPVFVSVPVVPLVTVSNDNKKRGGRKGQRQQQLPRIRNAHTAAAANAAATATTTAAAAAATTAGGGAINPRQEKRDAKLRDRAKATQRDNKASKMSVVFSQQQQQKQ
jgi:hypothetical protein